MDNEQMVRIKRQSLEAFTAAVDRFLAELDTDADLDPVSELGIGGAHDWDEIPPRPTDGARVIEATRVREE